MATQREKPRDLVGGVIVAAIGVVFFMSGRSLEFGDSFRMGAGYFPSILSILMICLGLTLIFQAWRGRRAEEAFQHIPWQGLLLINGSAVFFGLTIRGLGLAPVVAIVVLAAATASRYGRWKASVLLAAGMAVFCTFLFVYALGLPVPTFGPWLSLEHWSPAVTPPAQ